MSGTDVKKEEGSAASDTRSDGHDEDDMTPEQRLEWLRERVSAAACFDGV